jgi:hypothetical protein
MERSKFAPTLIIFLILGMQGLIYTLIGSGSLFLISSSSKVILPTQINTALFMVSVTTIVIAIWGSFMAIKRWALVFRLGIICNIAAVFFLGIETLAASSLPKLDYLLFLFSTLLLGAGNGIIFTIVPRLIADLFPEKTIGFMMLFFAAPPLGNMIAPFLLSISIYLDIVGLIGLFFALAYFLLLLFFDLFGFFATHQEPQEEKKRRKGVWFFAGSMLFVAFIETLLVNWSLFSYKVSDATSILFQTSLVTTLFWGSILVGRLIFGWVFKRYAFKVFYILFSALIIALTAFLYLSDFIIGPFILIVLGIAQSSVLPLNLSLGQKSFPANSLIALGIIFAGFWAGGGLATIAFTSFDLQPNSSDENLSLALLIGSIGLFICNLIVALRFKEQGPSPQVPDQVLK